MPDTATQRVTAEEAAAAVVEHLAAFTYNWSDERDLQNGIADVLAQRFTGVLREQPLSRRDRPDFLVTNGYRTVAVEVKVAGARNPILRQLGRYAEHGSVDAVVFASARRMLLAALPAHVHGKPLVGVLTAAAL